MVVGAGHLLTWAAVKDDRGQAWGVSGGWESLLHARNAPQQATSAQASWPSRRNFFMAMGGAVSPGDLMHDARHDCRLAPSTMTSVCL